MIPVGIPPQVDPLADAIFDALPEPEGFEFQVDDGQYLWPVYGQDSWRMILRNVSTGERVPVFFPGNLIRSLAKTLSSVNEEIKKAVDEPKLS